MQKEIEALVLRGLEEVGVEGATVAIVKDGEVILAEAYGYADRENNIAMTKEYALPIGSSSKAFTALGVMMLASEGKLDIDKPVREYMPRFCLEDPAARDVTARDLLCHRTGLPRHDLFWITWPGVERDDLVYNRHRHLKANKTFRSKWEYNNHMYAAAGKLIEEITQKSWEDFTRERIFKPLGMTSSFFWQDDPSDIKQSVLYKDKDGKRTPCESERVTALGPAGSIRATITDMARWLKFNLARGKVCDEALLDEASFNEMWKPNLFYELLPFSVPETRGIGYGLGWFIDCYRGELRVDHGGNVSGATALVSMLPEKNIGVVVLTNQNSSVLTYALASYIQDMLLERDCETDWYAFWKEEFTKLKGQQEEQFNSMREALTDKPMTHEGADYTGVFAHPGYGEISVTYDGQAENKLSVDMHGKVHPLIHMHYDVFRVEIHDIPIPVIFRTGAKGDISAVDIQMEMSLPEMVTYQRVPPEPEAENKD
jgi:CubicO group peptidase (beta-lactamase class C family)